MMKDVVKAFADKKGEAIVKMIEKADAKPGVILLYSFFYEITVCVQSGVCAKELACSIFKAPISAPYYHYKPLVEQWKKE